MDIVSNILSQLFQPVSQLISAINLLDVLIIVIVLFYAYEGRKLGFVIASLDLVGFVSAFIVALKFYKFAAGVLVSVFAMPIGLANALGFFLTALIVEVVLQIILRKLEKHLPRALQPKHVIARIFQRINHVLGIIPGVISAFIILSFLLSVIVALPSSSFIKNLVTGSKIGGKLLANMSFFENNLNVIFGGALNETLNFLTVETQSDKLVPLNFKVANGIPDGQAEMEMFRLVNTERARAGLDLLAFDNALRDVARKHSDDMLKRGYFSHYTPEKVSPFARMNKAGIAYTSAGENLAFAPSTELAMRGLMNSRTHRENILNISYRKIGIGVIDAGIYGKMYSQEFSD